MGSEIVIEEKRNSIAKMGISFVRPRAGNAQKRERGGERKNQKGATTRRGNYRGKPNGAGQGDGQPGRARGRYAEGKLE